MHPGGVGELRVTGQVTGRPDPRVRRLQPRIDLHEAPFIHRDPSLIEPELGGSGAAPDRDQHLIEADLTPVGQLGTPPHQPRSDSGDRGSGAHRRPVGKQRLSDQRGGVGILAGQQPGCRLHHRHRRAEPGEGLPELAADAAPTQDQQPARQRGQRPDRLARPGVRVGEPGDRRNCRCGAGGQQRLGEPDEGGAHLRGPWPGQTRNALRDVDPRVAQRGRGVGRLHRGNRLPHVRHDPHEVHLHASDIHPVAGGHTGIGSSMGGGEQRFAGDAASPQALTPGPVPLHQQHARPEPSGGLRRDDPRRAAPDHEQVPDRTVGRR